MEELDFLEDTSDVLRVLDLSGLAVEASVSTLALDFPFVEEGINSSACCCSRNFLIMLWTSKTKIVYYYGVK